MMKSKLLKIGLLLFFYALIISNHIENNTFYYIKPSSPNAEYRITMEDAKRLNLSVNKNLTKEEYALIKDVTYVNFSTKVRVLPFEASFSLFITIFMMMAVTLIVLNLNFNNSLNKNI